MIKVFIFFTFLVKFFIANVNGQNFIRVQDFINGNPEIEIGFNLPICPLFPTNYTYEDEKLKMQVNAYCNYRFGVDTNTKKIKQYNPTYKLGYINQERYVALFENELKAARFYHKDHIMCMTFSPYFRDQKSVWYLPVTAPYEPINSMAYFSEIECYPQ